MKKNTIEKKLNLSKQTIVNLDGSQLDKARGGLTVTLPCTMSCFIPTCNITPAGGIETEG